MVLGISMPGVVLINELKFGRPYYVKIMMIYLASLILSLQVMWNMPIGLFTFIVTH